MPWVSAEKLYTEDEMASFLLRAGQLAHVDPKGIKLQLASLYDRRIRARQKHRYWFDSVIAKSVPDILVSMNRKGECKKLYTPTTVMFVAETLGAVCSLCLRHHHNPRQSYSRNIPHLERFLCPSMFGSIGYDTSREIKARAEVEFQFVTPLCGTCHGFIYDARSVWKQYEGEGICRERKITEIFACDVIRHLHRKNARFAEHLNSARVPKLRFDPRRFRRFQLEQNAA
jgi:hypothetical protein